MKRIFIPAKSPDDWQQFLADPETQWKVGYSARALAYAWHNAKGLPPEIEGVFSASGLAQFQKIEPLLILPEYKTSLKGSGHQPQNDIFALLKGGDGQLIALAVEGKVDEEIGNRLGKWKITDKGFTPNKQSRLAHIQAQIGLEIIPDEIRYQLLHRSAAAILEAKRFNAPSAVMLVHSFSPQKKWFAEYADFLALYGVQAEMNTLHHVKRIGEIDFYAAWVQGDPHFLTV